MKKIQRAGIKGIAIATASIMAASPVFAAGWQHNSTGWWYGTNSDNTAWHSNGWQWVDGNGDGTAECYYFGPDGYMYAGKTTPDGYTVNADGAWVNNGAVQTKSVTAGSTGLAVSNEQNGAWQHGTGANASRWQWKNSDGTIRKGGWYWLDGNRDGIAECYYLDSEGWMASDCRTPDGYTVNAGGAWVEGNTVRTKSLNSTGPGSGTTVSGTAAVGGGGGGGGGGGSSSGGGGSSSSSTDSNKIIEDYLDQLWKDYYDDTSSYYAYMDFTDGNRSLMSDSQWNKVVSKVNEFKSKYITSGMSDFEKEIRIIEWIVENCSYDKTTTNCASAYGCIVEGKAKCMGYADAFLQTAKLCGLDVRYVYSRNHAWNLIKLDGEWYHVDTTWEDPTGTKNGYYGFKNLRNKYINLTDEEISKEKSSHKSWEPSSISADGTKYGNKYLIDCYSAYGYYKADLTVDDYRRYRIENDPSTVTSTLGNAGLRLDDGSNYFANGEADKDRLVAYLRSCFDKKKAAYVTFPERAHWLTGSWLNEALNSTGFAGDIADDEYKLLSSNNSIGYRIPYSTGYRTLAEISATEAAHAAKHDTLVAAQGGSVFTNDTLMVNYIKSQLDKEASTITVVYDADVITRINQGVSDADKEKLVKTQSKSIDSYTINGKKYSVCTYTVTYKTLEEALKSNFSQTLNSDKSNIFIDSFDTNINGKSFSDVYANATGGVTVTAKIPVIYKDGMDEDALKSKIISLFENAGLPVKDSTYYLATYKSATIKGTKYWGAKMTFSLELSRDAAIDALNDEYKDANNANIFTYTNQTDMVNTVAEYVETALNGSFENGATFYYILDSDDKTVTVGSKLHSKYNSGEEDERYTSIYFDTSYYSKVEYSDGTLLVFRFKIWNKSNKNYLVSSSEISLTSLDEETPENVVSEEEKKDETVTTLEEKKNEQPADPEDDTSDKNPVSDNEEITE